jgi:hypothetical protein
MDHLKICRVVYPRTISGLDNFYQVIPGNGYYLRFSQEKQAKKCVVVLNKEINRVFFSINQNFASLVYLLKSQLFADFKANLMISKYICDAEFFLSATMKNYSTSAFQMRKLFSGADTVYFISKMIAEKIPNLQKSAGFISENGESDMKTLINLGCNYPAMEIFYNEYSKLLSEYCTNCNKGNK